MIEKDYENKYLVFLDWSQSMHLVKRGLSPHTVKIVCNFYGKITGNQLSIPIPLF